MVLASIFSPFDRCERVDCGLITNVLSACYHTRTFVTGLLDHIGQREKIALEIARMNGPYNFHIPFLFLYVVNDFDLEGFPKRSSVCGSSFEV